MTHNIWFALPSLTAFLILAWIIFRADKISIVKESKPLALLFFSLVGISFIEFGTYTKLLTPSLLLMKLFYISCFIGMSGIFSQALKVSGLSVIFIKRTYKGLGAFCIFLIILMLGSNLLVSGFEFISYSYTREPGQFYWLVQLFLISTILSTILLLTIGTKNKNKIDARRSKFLLLSISPLLLIALVLIILMQSGIKINASIIFPVFISYYLMMILQTEKDESLFSLLMKVPFSRERESFKEISKEVQQFLISTELSFSEKTKMDSLSLKDLTASIEGLIVEHAVKLNQGSQVRAASLLGVSSSSICRKKNKS